MRARTGRPWGHWAPCTEGFMGQRESTRRAEDKWRGIECRQKPHLHFSESILQIRLKFRISTSSYSWALPGSVFPVYSKLFQNQPSVLWQWAAIWTKGLNRAVGSSPCCREREKRRHLLSGRTKGYRWTTHEQKTSQHGRKSSNQLSADRTHKFGESRAFIIFKLFSNWAETDQNNWKLKKPYILYFWILQSSLTLGQ